VLLKALKNGISLASSDFFLPYGIFGLFFNAFIHKAKSELYY
jgi:hypothetical protein